MASLARTGAIGEREQLRETKGPVARDARVRRLTACVTADERRHDRAAELVTQVERDVRQAEPVARLARRDHGARRAARTLRVGPRGIHPEPQRHADCARTRAQQGDRAIDAAAHRDGDALGIRLRAKDLRERVGQRVDGERLAADRRSLEQRQTFERALETRCVRGDDVLAFDGEPDERELGAAR